jgi:hypothetical protein
LMHVYHLILLNFSYYQHVIDIITVMGPSYKGSNFHDLHGYYLQR